MEIALRSGFPSAFSISVPDSTPTAPSEPDASSDDSGESRASDEASAVVRTAVVALDAMLGPAPTDNRDTKADASAEDALSDPH